MKKIFLVIAVATLAIALTGCQSGKKTTNTDDAESAAIVSESAAAVNAPPVPPVPTKPAQ